MGSRPTRGAGIYVFERSIVERIHGHVPGDQRIWSAVPGRVVHDGLGSGRGIRNHV